MEKSLDLFYHQPRNKGARHHSCIECMNKDHIAKGRNHGPKRTTMYRGMRRDNKIKAIALKGGICEKCGIEGPPCIYDFHHIDPMVKEYSISSLWGSAWEKIEAELEKCMLLCANCHRKVHWEKEQS